MLHRKKAINKLIRRTFIEMSLLIFAVIGSYFVFSHANLSESANIAREYSTGENALQVMVGHNDSATYLNSQNNLIDKTILTVRNPNKGEKYVDVYMIILNPQSVVLDGMYVQFMGQRTDASSASIGLNTYKLKIYSGMIGGYLNMSDEVLIYDENYVSSLQYTFLVEESHYK